MDRRKLLKGSIAFGIAGSFVGLGWFASAGDPSKLTIKSINEELAQLIDQPLTSTGAWSPFKIFSHCRQSIQLSISGYPQHKSDFFKSSVGSLAFKVFEHIGTMRHGLDEAIPGAEALVAEGDAHVALQQLIASLNELEQHPGPFADHFAYGALTKQQTIAAHVLHIRNHLTEINIG